MHMVASGFCTKLLDINHTLIQAYTYGIGYGFASSAGCEQATNKMSRVPVQRCGCADWYAYPSGQLSNICGTSMAFVSSSATDTGGTHRYDPSVFTHSACGQRAASEHSSMSRHVFQSLSSSQPVGHTQNERPVRYGTMGFVANTSGPSRVHILIQPLGGGVQVHSPNVFRHVCEHPPLLSKHSSTSSQLWPSAPSAVPGRPAHEHR